MHKHTTCGGQFGDCEGDSCSACKQKKAVNRHSLNDDVVIRERNAVTIMLLDFLGSYKRLKI